MMTATTTSEPLVELKDDLQQLLKVLLDYDTADALIEFIDCYMEENLIGPQSYKDFFQSVRAEISNGIRNAYASKYFEEKWGSRLTRKTMLWLVDEASIMNEQRIPLYESANILLNELRTRSNCPLVRNDEIGRKHLIGVISRAYNCKLRGMPPIVDVEFSNSHNDNYNDLLDAVEKYIELMSNFWREDEQP